MQSSLLLACALSLAPAISGHGFLRFPPMRGGVSGSEMNAFCPQCGNGMTVCGDGGQWGASSNLLGYAGGPWSAVTAGDVVEFAVEITAHHRGHFEFGLCDKQVGPSTTDAQSCFDSRKLKRAPLAADCAPDDARGDCQPLDEEHPERWYLPPGVGTHKMRFQIPSDFECVSCTLQWRWWTANSCAPAEDYGCYFEKMNALGWTAHEWCGTYCGTCGAPTEGTPGCGGEEFRNCADIEVRGAGNASGASTTQMPPSPTPTPTTGLAGTTLPPATEGACVRNDDCAGNPWCQDESYHKWCADQGAAGACPEPRCTRGSAGGGAVPTPAPSTTSMAATSEAPPAPAPATSAAASTGAPSTTATGAPPALAPAPGTTAAPTPQTCVSRAALQCINDYSSYWPRCSPEQAKSTVGPAGYEFGDYCDGEWAAALNEVLSDPAVDICGDEEAIRKFLAQVAYETGYYTTVYQTADGGAGLIHMIPGNWATNAQDMDAMWPGNGYAEKAASMGKNFFQTAAYGWRSVAAWFKRTNRVIGGCGVDLFGQPYERQTQCILSRAVDRSEAYGVVGRCLAQFLADAAGTSAAPPVSEATSSTQPEAEPATAASTTAAASTAAASTTAASTTSASSVPSGATCVRNTDCGTSPWCAQAGYAAWCAAEGAQGSCPFPQCVLAQTQAPSLLSQDGGARAARRKRQRFLGTALIQRSGRLQQRAKAERAAEEL